MNEQNRTGLSEKQAAEIAKKKRGAKWVQDLAADGGVNIEPGDNSRYIRLAMASWNLPPIDISDPVQVEQRIGEYFQHCADNDRKPQIVGMANWLGVSRDTVNSWKRGEYRGDTHSDIIKKAIDMLEELWIDYMQNGKVNPGAGIFLGKNLFGYKDVADVVVTPNNPLQDMDTETARKRLIDSIPDEDDEE